MSLTLRRTCLGLLLVAECFSGFAAASIPVVQGLRRRPASEVAESAQERFEGRVADLHMFFLEGGSSEIQVRVSRTQGLSVEGNLSQAVVRFRFQKDGFRGAEHTVEFETRWLPDGEISRKHSELVRLLAQKWGKFRWSSLVNSSRRPDPQGFVPANLVVPLLFEATRLPARYAVWCQRPGERYSIEARVKGNPNPLQNLNASDPVRADEVRYMLKVQCE